MSWKFAGMVFRGDRRSSYPDLLHRLGVDYAQSAGGFTFGDAIDRDNRATALGVIGDSTLLLHRLIPYDCSYEAGQEGPLDAALASLSEEGDVLSDVLDGVSGTYCFAAFGAGSRIRRWAAQPSGAFCDEGSPLEGERPTSGAAGSGASEGAASAPLDHEARLFAVWGAFVGTPFQTVVKNEAPDFRFFL